ncbi:MAG: hypothetical protein K6G69_07930 [Lachnospiraceae bacterium]|nr:hypothetical protein [Lachnospiraceae bacterium]
MMKNKLLSPIIYFCIAVICVYCALFIPRQLINKRYSAQTDIVCEAPAETYINSESAMSKYSSSLLTSLQRIKIITGLWENSCRLTDDSKGNMTEADAVSLAISKIDAMYNFGLYPRSFKSAVNNWYAWDGELYEYTDIGTNTYTCYLWKLTFTRSDRSEKHIVLMTEDGVILFAGCNEITDFTCTSAREIANLSTELLCNKDIRSSSIRGIDLSYSVTDIYPQLNDLVKNGSSENAGTAYDLNIVMKNNSSEDYVVFLPDASLQGYNIGIVPKMCFKD